MLPTTPPRGICRKVNTPQKFVIRLEKNVDFSEEINVVEIENREDAALAEVSAAAEEIEELIREQEQKKLSPDKVRQRQRSSSPHPGRQQPSRPGFGESRTQRVTPGDAQARQRQSSPGFSSPRQQRVSPGPSHSSPASPGRPCSSNSVRSTAGRTPPPRGRKSSSPAELKPLPSIPLGPSPAVANLGACLAKTEDEWGWMGEFKTLVTTYRHRKNPAKLKGKLTRFFERRLSSKMVWLVRGELLAARSKRCVNHFSNLSPQLFDTMFEIFCHDNVD